MWDFTDDELDELERLFKGGRECPSPTMALRMVRCLRRNKLRNPTFAQVFPLTAVPLASRPSSHRIFVLDPAGPWTSGEVTAAGESQEEAEQVLDDHGVYDPDGLVHETSTRGVRHPTGNYRIDTFLAVIPFQPSLLVDFPNAEAVTDELLQAWGPPPVHGGMDIPRVSTGHTLTHALAYAARELEGGLAHFAERIDPERGDAQMADDLRRLHCEEHLRELAPTLFAQHREVLPVP